MMTSLSPIISLWDFFRRSRAANSVVCGRIPPNFGHVITGNLKIIPDSRIRNIVSKGSKYRFP